VNTASNLGEAISSASLVLAVLTALYTLWLPDVSDALKITPKTDLDDRGPQKIQTWRALWSKVLPLALATISATTILTPRVLGILKEFCASHTVWQYDDVKALFILTWALLLLLALVASVQLFGLLRKLKRLHNR
jgi:hypothetical protein